MGTSRWVGCCASALTLALAQAAAAQSAGPTAAAPSAVRDDTGVIEEIVVTGTLVRGIAPVGTNVQGFDAADIEVMGVTATHDFLSRIPVISNKFNTVPATLPGIGASVQRPNIRNLGLAGGNTTLVLVDGHNVVGAGILLTSPDAGALPPGVLERVEIMADGGSSLYGADAVGGIINFITRKDFDGVEVTGHFGVADPGYEAGDLNLTAGTSWNRGSGLFSVSRRESSNLSASDRDYPRQDLRPEGGDDFRQTTCNQANVIVDGVPHAYPDLVPGTLNRCDLAVFDDIMPEEDQTSVFGSLTHELTDRITLETTAYWSDRETRVADAQLTAADVMIPITNPFFVPVAGQPAQTVSFSFAPVLGPRSYSRSEVEQYGITPVLTFQLDNAWQVELLVNYGRSKTRTHSPLINQTALTAAAAGTTPETALNPYDLTQTNPAVIEAIADFENFGRNTQTLEDYRIVADGPIAAAPGGDVLVALGAEYQRQTSDALSVFNERGNLDGAILQKANRYLASAFGQIVVPLVGAGNGLPFMDALTMDASVRYDDYSDFGDTTNPKIGITWDITETLSLRGNWGTSFNAPSLADTTGAVDTRASILPFSPFRAPDSPITDLFRPTVILAGGNPDLKPQTADTWSAGLDWSPAFAAGLTAGITYWDVKLEDTITVAPPGFPTSLFTVPAFQQFALVNPSLAEAQALTAGMFIDGAPSIEALFAVASPYAIIDARRKNIGTLFVSGLDFYGDYVRPTGFGTVFVSLNGTYLLERDSQPFSGAPKEDLLDNNASRLAISATIGASWRNFRGSATMNYSAGYDVVGAGDQDDTGAFSPVNLALTYEFDGSSAWNEGLSLTLNVDNVFDEEVPFLNAAPGSGVPVNGSTIGRFVNLGLRKQF
ncbi:MAG TPA: TonB-dependent receptor [Pseudomonadales bacterium]